MAFLNNHFVGNLGLGGGAVSTTALVTFIQQPQNLLDLYYHRPNAIASLVAIVLCMLVSYLGAYLGMPKTVTSEGASVLKQNTQDPSPAIVGDPQK